MSYWFRFGKIETFEVYFKMAKIVKNDLESCLNFLNFEPICIMVVILIYTFFI